MRTEPRSIFRCRRNRILVVTDHGPEANYLPAAIEAGRRQKPGTFTEVRVWHDHDCPRPKGGKCKCKHPDVDVVDAERN
jgi:hypothetical protein